MPDGETPIPTQAEAERPFFLDGTTRAGAVRRGSMVIGHYEGDTLVLDLGWCRMAGVDVTVLDDKMRGDNHRGGIAFERKAR